MFDLIQRYKNSDNGVIKVAIVFFIIILFLSILVGIISFVIIRNIHGDFNNSILFRVVAYLLGASILGIVISIPVLKILLILGLGTKKTISVEYEKKGNTKYTKKNKSTRK